MPPAPTRTSRPRKAADPPNPVDKTQLLADATITYAPMIEPDLEEWQSLDEWTQIDLVREYHRRAEVDLPNEKIHAVLHVVVENQIALGDEVPTVATVQRLLREGLDRHEAVHAAGTVITDIIYDIFKGRDRGPDPNKKFRKMNKLTARRWRKGKW